MKRKPYIKYLLNLMDLKSFCKEKKGAWIITIHHGKREKMGYQHMKSVMVWYVGSSQKTRTNFSLYKKDLH